MIVDYDDYAKTFAHSRQNLRWPELCYFLSQISQDDIVVDIACWSWRLIDAFRDYFKLSPNHYIGIDASKKLLLEARKNYPWYPFLVWNMEDEHVYTSIYTSSWDKKKSLFCIAWFHHISNIKQRIITLRHWYNLLSAWERVYMTNWALESPVNKKRYINSMIQNSENEFWWHDFSIKIWKHNRWYHSFSLSELDYLAKEVGFTIIENCLFSTEKNFITILEK